MPHLADARGQCREAALHGRGSRGPGDGRLPARLRALHPRPQGDDVRWTALDTAPVRRLLHGRGVQCLLPGRSEEHTSELQSLMRISYAVFCLKKKKTTETGEKRKAT